MNVALRPPVDVYKMTPQGIKKLANSYFIPVSASTVAAPPNKSIEVTMMLAQNAKKRKVICADLPQRARTISHMVCAEGAISLRLIARTPNSSTWIVAPDAYLGVLKRGREYDDVLFVSMMNNKRYEILQHNFISCTYDVYICMICTIYEHHLPERTTDTILPCNIGTL